MPVIVVSTAFVGPAAWKIDSAIWNMILLIIALEGLHVRRSRIHDDPLFHQPFEASLCCVSGMK